ncbi:hypothetical protein [Nocardia sp. NPDC050412]
MSISQPGPVSHDATVEEAVAWVRFDRPDARNTLAEMRIRS